MRSRVLCDVCIEACALCGLLLAQASYNTFTFTAGTEYTYTGTTSTSRETVFLVELGDES